MESMADWERPISGEELEAIEAACDSAVSSIKRRRPNRADDGGDVTNGNCRRLPRSVTRRSSSGVRSSDQVNIEVRNPAIRFGGRIIYSRTISEIEKAAMDLLEITKAKGNGEDHVILGFDIEWRPTFQRGVAPRKAAVMQICPDASHCYVMHIIHSGIPPILRSLLENPKYVKVFLVRFLLYSLIKKVYNGDLVVQYIYFWYLIYLKVGIGIANDAIKIWKDYNVCVKAVEDLSALANLKLCEPRTWGLASLTEILTGKQLEKPNKIRLGNWEVDILSRQQLQYAATDAFASWHLHEILKGFPDVVNDQNIDQKDTSQA